MIRIFFIWLCLSFVLSSDSQVIIGSTIDMSNGQTLPYVSVILKDISYNLIGFTSTTNNGSFTIVNVPKKDSVGLLMIEYLGFKADTLELKNLMLKDTINIGEYKLEATNVELQNIEVTASKSLYKFESDKITMNVSSNPLLNVSSNASELISKAPGISNDVMGNIILRGKSGVNVLINGKSLHLSGENLTNYLKSLSVTSIDKIEIIANPKTSFDASGTSGIINLVLKKNEQLGLTSTIFGGVSKGLYPRFNAGGNIFYRPNENHSFNINLSNYQGKYKTINYSTRFLQNTKEQNLTFLQKGNSNSKINNTNLSFGYEFEQNNNTLGLAISSIQNSTKIDNRSNTDVYSSKIDSVVNFGSAVSSNLKNFSITLNDKYTIDTIGGYIEFNASYFPARYASSTNQTSSFIGSNGEKYKNDEYEKFNMPSTINIKAITFDIVKTTKFGDFDAGLKLSHAKSDNNLEAYNYINNWELDKRRSNQFIFDEKIYAAYAGLKYYCLGFEIYNGIRVEQSISKGNSVTIDSTFKRNLLYGFPYLSISKNIGTSNISASYGRRIDRPIYNQLNPFEYYIDRFSYWKGNVNLMPQITDSYDLSLNYKWLMASFNYSKTKNFFTQIPEQNLDNGSIYNTYQNIGISNYYGATFTSNNYFGNNWSMFNNLGIYYIATLDNTTPNISNNRVSGLQFSFNTSNTFSLSKTLNLDVSCQYFSRNKSFWVMDAYYNINLGLKKTLKNNSALSIQIFDVFNATKYLAKTNYQSLNIESYYKPETRFVSLNYYKIFGNSKTKKNKKVVSSLEEEKKRVKYN